MTVMQVRAERHSATRYGSPYGVIEAFAEKKLTEDELVEILGKWSYAPIPDRSDPAGVLSESRGYTPGSAQDILKALNRRLIDRQLYSRIRESIHEHQGD